MSRKKKYEPVEIFPRLYDIEPFLISDPPVLHPYSESYAKYWEEQERLSFEGLWGLDSDGKNGGWRYMPGSLYYSSGFCVLFAEETDQEDGVNTNAPIRPRPRDIDWVMDYGNAAARGFSGFEFDEHSSCHRALKELEIRGWKNLSPRDKIFLEKHEDDLRGKNRDWKKYVNAIDYLYETKPEKLGRALWKNTALNNLTMGPRGYGKSWKIVFIISYEFRVCGLRYFNDKAMYDLPAIELMIISSDTDKTAETLDKFKKLEHHLRYLGSWGKGEDFIPGFWYLNTMGTLENNNMDRPYRHEYKSKEGQTWNTKTGTGSRIYNKVATKQNLSVGAGPRPLYIFHEEAALSEDVDKISAINENSLKKENKIGTEWLIATGGIGEKHGKIKKMFYNPAAYKMVEYPNLYRKGGKNIAGFIPKTHVSLAFKDKNGNTNSALALEQELYDRKLLEDTGDLDRLQHHIIFNCLNPEEMLGGTLYNIFPTIEISDTITDLEIYRKKVEEDYIYGTFVSDGLNAGEYKIKVNNKLRGRYFENPLEDKNKYNKDTVIIFQQPQKHNGETGQYLNPYKIVFDPIKDDFSGISYACIIVYKGFSPGMKIDEYTDNLVAIFFGRPEKVEETYLIAIQLAKLYSGKVLFENNIYDFAKWCYRKGYGEYLQYTPWLAINKKIKNPSRKYKVGVNIQKELKNYTLRLVKNLVTKKISYGEETVMWIKRVKFLRLLYELSLFGELKNYDSISAMQILALWLDQEDDPLIHEIINNNKSTLNNFHKSLINDLNVPNMFTNEY